MVVQATFGENENCSICKLSDIDCVNYGEIHANKELAVHLFCLYFSTYLPQTGRDSSDIVGFEVRDIRKLIKGCVKVKCCYCQNGSATTYCQYPNCKRTFHQVCGFKVNARFEYLSQFLSFCDEHNSIENQNFEYPRFVGCYICYEPLGDYHPVKTVPSCCGQWFHQNCLRKYALNAGYAFMCPTCRSKTYGDFARRHGIYVPEYEALGEKTNDYSDIDRLYTHCDAKDCICPNGHTFSNQKWNLQVCSCCGSYGFHRLCRPKAEQKDIIICDVCQNVVRNQENNEREIIVTLSTTSPSRILNEEREANDDVRTVVDLTDNVPNENAVEDDKVIDLTDDNIMERNIVEADVPSNRKMSEIQQKYEMERSLRPIRNEMRDYRISLWFRDYAMYFRELDGSRE